jgi:hypothetical protein
VAAKAFRDDAAETANGRGFTASAAAASPPSEQDGKRSGADVAHLEAVDSRSRRTVTVASGVRGRRRFDSSVETVSRYRPAARLPALVHPVVASAARLARSLREGAIVSAATALVLLPQLSRPGPEMDEGMVLSYATRVLHGAVPYRDFETFYGPGNLWDVAGAFALFGTHQWVERAVGLAYVVATVVAIYVIVRRASRLAAIASVAIVLAIAADSGVWAYATRAAVAFFAVGLALATGLEGSTARRERLRLAAAGILAGWALLCRFDFCLPVLLSMPVVLSGVRRGGRLVYLAAFASAVLLYVPYLVLAGTGGVGRTFRDLLASLPGRRLSFPAPNVLPTGSLVFGGMLCLLLLLGTGLVLRRRAPAHAVPLLAAALAIVGAIPFVLSRTDASHVKPIAVLAFGFLPLAAALLRRDARGRGPLPDLVAVAVSLSLVWGVGPIVSELAVRDVPAIANGSSAYAAATVTSRGRSFVLSDTREAANAQRVVSAADRLSRPGDRLFVGPYDLRRSIYGPTYLYFLLPQLRPASYFMEFNPWGANRPGSGLARDVARAKWIILVSSWDTAHESNASSRLGSAVPNAIVRTDFCLLLHAGAYRLYEARGARAGCPSRIG